jgi:hypothetical protein
MITTNLLSPKVKVAGIHRRSKKTTIASLTSTLHLLIMRTGRISSKLAKAPDQF